MGAERVATYPKYFLVQSYLRIMEIPTKSSSCFLFSDRSSAWREQMTALLFVVGVTFLSQVRVTAIWLHLSSRTFLCHPFVGPVGNLLKLRCYLGPPVVQKPGLIPDGIRVHSLLTTVQSSIKCGCTNLFMANVQQRYPVDQ